MFDQNAMTAAHSSLPLGSRIRVTMQDTGASVIVTVTDRQPHKYIRVIDLSRGAASRIGLLNRGTAMVTLETARRDDVVEVAEAPGASSPDASSHPRSRRTRRQRRFPAATWSATYAPRLPNGFGPPSVLSRAVCSSSAEFSSAPSNTA